ncbi:hypothetical protein C8R45DRAFT_1180924 [Mycena sanguinolenta]|nr:hypothetical protein C8R45DRAFT_1180924 [Mycena sanguinolenta]
MKREEKEEGDPSQLRRGGERTRIVLHRVAKLRSRRCGRNPGSAGTEGWRSEQRKKMQRSGGGTLAAMTIPLDCTRERLQEGACRRERRYRCVERACEKIDDTQPMRRAAAKSQVPRSVMRRRRRFVEGYARWPVKKQLGDAENRGNGKGGEATYREPAARCRGYIDWAECREVTTTPALRQSRNSGAMDESRNIPNPAMSSLSLQAHEALQMTVDDSESVRIPATFRETLGEEGARDSHVRRNQTMPYRQRHSVLLMGAVDSVICRVPVLARGDEDQQGPNPVGLQEREQASDICGYKDLRSPTTGFFWCDLESPAFAERRNYNLARRIFCLATN